MIRHRMRADTVIQIQELPVPRLRQRPASPAPTCSRVPANESVTRAADRCRPAADQCIILASSPISRWRFVVDRMTTVPLTNVVHLGKLPMMQWTLGGLGRFARAEKLRTKGVDEGSSPGPFSRTMGSFNLSGTASTFAAPPANMFHEQEGQCRGPQTD